MMSEVKLMDGNDLFKGIKSIIKVWQRGVKNFKTWEWRCD